MLRIHPLHPASVHMPVTCILFTPFLDAGSLFLHADLWPMAAYVCAAAMVFGLVAASFGALDFEKAHAKAPRTVIAHAGAMALALGLEGVSLLGRFAADGAVRAPAPTWAIAAGAGALGVMLAGAYFGGDLVYRHGVNVDDKS